MHAQAKWAGRALRAGPTASWQAVGRSWQAGHFGLLWQSLESGRFWKQYWPVCDRQKQIVCDQAWGFFWFNFFFLFIMLVVWRFLEASKLFNFRLLLCCWNKLHSFWGNQLLNLTFFYFFCWCSVQKCDKWAKWAGLRLLLTKWSPVWKLRLSVTSEAHCAYSCSYLKSATLWCFKSCC